MKILAVYNIKGGVGKTATAVNLAWLAARDGWRTLLWDLDPQAAATFYLRIRPGTERGAEALLQGKTEIEVIVKETDFPNLDLLPADFAYRNMDLILNADSQPALRLMRLLRPLGERYDYLLLDCPPSISLVSENVFRAADGLIVPFIPTTLSLRTYEQLLGYLKDNRLDQIVTTLPFFSMVDRRKKLHNELMEELSKRFPEMLQSFIPYATEVERMGPNRGPVFTFAQGSAPAQAYEALWNEIQGRL